MNIIRHMTAYQRIRMFQVIEPKRRNILLINGGAYVDFIHSKLVRDILHEIIVDKIFTLTKLHSKDIIIFIFCIVVGRHHRLYCCYNIEIYFIF